jgi:hypothetical protein
LPSSCFFDVRQVLQVKLIKFGGGVKIMLCESTFDYLKIFL